MNKTTAFAALLVQVITMFGPTDETPQANKGRPLYNE